LIAAQSYLRMVAARQQLGYDRENELRRKKVTDR